MANGKNQHCGGAARTSSITRSEAQSPSLRSPPRHATPRTSADRASCSSRDARSFGLMAGHTSRARWKRCCPLIGWRMRAPCLIGSAAAEPQPEYPVRGISACASRTVSSTGADKRSRRPPRAASGRQQRQQRQQRQGRCCRGDPEAPRTAQPLRTRPSDEWTLRV